MERTERALEDGEFVTVSLFRECQPFSRAPLAFLA
jgi:hypothetical protein